MVCIVCKQEICPGHLVIQVPVLCQAVQSTRDPTRLYFQPVHPAGPDIIHFHCLIEYTDPTVNDATLESLKAQARNELEAELRIDMRDELALEVQSESYSEMYDQFITECEEEGWLTPKFYADHQ